MRWNLQQREREREREREGGGGGGGGHITGVIVRSRWMLATLQLDFFSL